jgi:hypothetical protein
MGYSLISCAQWKPQSGSTSYSVVIPAQAGIYLSTAPCHGTMGPGLRRGDEKVAERL